MLRPHIVILGAGFGGMYVAKKLLSQVKNDSIDITLVNETNYFLFTPLLHEVATGSLSPISVAEPLREIFVDTGINICQGVIKNIDRTKKVVLVESEVSSLNASRKTNHEISYDYLVIATGSSTNYYGISGADTYTYQLKNLSDAVRIRSRIIDSFEEAVLCADPVERARLLSFTVVGGGATGVEVTAEIAELVRGMLKRYYSRSNESKKEEPTISLIHAGKELLQQFDQSLRKVTEKRLKDEGVILHLESIVTSVTPKGLTLANNTTISTATIIWCAGVKANIPEFVNESPVIDGGRLVVDEYFHLNGDERVFALGDVAQYQKLPMLAQVTVQQAKIVCKNILASINNKSLNKFSYHSKGSMVSIGQWFAIGEIYSRKFVGKFTWWMWRTVYLFKFISWKKRTRIAIDWIFDALYPRDITKL